MVFCNTRYISDYVDKNLRSNGINAAAIHGGLTQNKRLKTIDRFNSNEVNVLVCTDVAARGLHIKNVSHVINYDLPRDPNDYIHRIGRTARAGESGQVINLLTNIDRDAHTKIERTNKTFNIETQEPGQFREAIISNSRNESNKGKRTHRGRRHTGQAQRGNDGPKRTFHSKGKHLHTNKKKVEGQKPGSGGYLSKNKKDTKKRDFRHKPKGNKARRK